MPCLSWDGQRTPIGLAVRMAASTLLAEREREPRAGYPMIKRHTRNLVLQRVSEELRAKRLGLSEYVALAARWRSLVALPAFATLQDDWRISVENSTGATTQSLPDPAKDAAPAELELVRKHSKQLSESMRVDPFDNLLENIAKGDAPR